MTKPLMNNWAKLQNRLCWTASRARSTDSSDCKTGNGLLPLIVRWRSLRGMEVIWIWFWKGRSGGIDKRQCAAQSRVRCLKFSGFARPARTEGLKGCYCPHARFARHNRINISLIRHSFSKEFFATRTINGNKWYRNSRTSNSCNLYCRKKTQEMVALVNQL